MMHGGDASCIATMHRHPQLCLKHSCGCAGGVSALSDRLDSGQRCAAAGAGAKLKGYWCLLQCLHGVVRWCREQPPLQAVV